jgi:hypothetical protein
MLFDGGLPLTDLCPCSLQLQKTYSTFQERLEGYLSLLDSTTLPITGNKDIDATLKILKTVRENEVASATDQDVVMGG